MKITQLFASIAAIGAIALFAVAADAPATPYTVTLDGTHMCCQKCVNGAAAAVKSISGVTAVGDTDKKSILITAPDLATAQKAVDALTSAGYYGSTTDKAIKVNGETGAKAEMVSSLEISNLHLCCGSCVKAVGAALAGVPGYKANDSKTGAKTFTVTGDFKATDVMAALQKAGLTGKAGATQPEAPAADAKKS